MPCRVRARRRGRLRRDVRSEVDSGAASMTPGEIRYFLPTKAMDRSSSAGNRSEGKLELEMSDSSLLRSTDGPRSSPRLGFTE